METQAAPGHGRGEPRVHGWTGNRLPQPREGGTQEQDQPCQVTAHIRLGGCVCWGFRTPSPSATGFGNVLWERRQQLRWLHHSG